MSYLHPVRLHFAGKFRADVSTVNNDVIHYNSRTFDDCFQKSAIVELACTFNGQPDYLDTAIGLMFDLKLQAINLMSIRIDAKHDGRSVL